MKEMRTLTIEQQKLVEEHMALVDNYVKLRFFKSSLNIDLSMEDLRQEGYIALCYAALYYTASKGAFKSYARAAIHNALLDYFKHACRHIPNLSLDQAVGEDCDTTIGEFLRDPSQTEIFIEVENNNLLEWYAKKASPFTRTGLHAIQLQLAGNTAEEIGREYGKSRNYINAIISKARKKMSANSDLRDALCA